MADKMTVEPLGTFKITVDVEEDYLEVDIKATLTDKSGELIRRFEQHLVGDIENIPNRPELVKQVCAALEADEYPEAEFPLKHTITLEYSYKPGQIKG